MSEPASAGPLAAAAPVEIIMEGLAPAAFRRVRLLNFMTLFGMGGTEKQVVNLATRLDKSRFELSFACLRRWGHLLKEIEDQRLPVAEYPLRSFYSLDAARQMARFIRDLRRRQIDIVHSYNFYANVFSIPAARLAGIPCIVASIRDMGADLTPMQARVQRWLCGLADRIVVNAEAIGKELVRAGYKPEAISVIRNGLDIAKYAGKNQAPGLRQELSLPPNAPLVTMLSRVSPQKGIEYFLIAAGQVRKRRPDTCFLVVGDAYTANHGVIDRDDAYWKRIKHAAIQHGLQDCIRFTGMRSDIPELLSETAVSVLPSLSEGISNTLLESMAAGAPIVATRVGGTPEVIEDDEHGLLVQPKDPQALAEAICSILENPWLAEHLSRQARRRVENVFSMERMVRANEALYMSLLENKLAAKHDVMET
jgi:glycosyltransferase involved in cell wall biosynthesis